MVKFIPITPVITISISITGPVIATTISITLPVTENYVRSPIKFDQNPQYWVYSKTHYPEMHIIPYIISCIYIYKKLHFIIPRLKYHSISSINAHKYRQIISFLGTPADSTPARLHKGTRPGEILLL